MCARIFYLLLAAVLFFVVGTIAAFKYLDWWLAPFVSAIIFLMLLRIGKFLTYRTIKIKVGDLAKGMFDVKSRVLRGATVDVHLVRSTSIPGTLLAELEEPNRFENPVERETERNNLLRLAWFEIEATIFPDPSQAGPMSHWDLADLRIVSSDTKPLQANSSSESSDEEVTLHDPRWIDNGVPREVADAKFRGPCRLRFTVGVPREINSLKFQYYFEQFGEIKLPSPLSLPMGR